MSHLLWHLTLTPFLSSPARYEERECAQPVSGKPGEHHSDPISFRRVCCCIQIERMPQN
jgi:hypothetical protein